MHWHTRRSTWYLLVYRYVRPTDIGHISSWSLHISIYHISTWHTSSWFSCYMLIGLDSVVCSIISMPICSYPLDIISVQIPSIIHHKCTQMRLEVEEHYHMQSILWSLRGSKDCTSSIFYRCNEDWLLLLNISCMFLEIVTYTYIYNCM